MLLALWADFWNPLDWLTGVTVPPPQPGAGGGHKKHHHYERPNSDFWDERQKVLERFAEKYAPLPAEMPERFPETAEVFSQRKKLVALAPQMPDLKAIADLGEMIDALDLQIEKYRVKCDEEALLALLL